MFGFSKKEQETMNHPFMGKLVYQSVWLGEMVCNIYDSSSTITLIIYVDEDVKDNLNVQEKAYIYYRDNMDIINAEVREELLKTYEIDNLSKLNEHFIPTTFIINQNGDCALSFRDQTDPRGFSSAQIVVTVLPKIEYYGSEDDYI